MTTPALIGATVAFSASPYVAHAAVEVDDRKAAAVGVVAAAIAGSVLGALTGVGVEHGTAVGVFATLIGMLTA